MSIERIVLILHRVTGALQLALGLAFWTGHAFGLVNLHMAIGVLFVLLLWTMAAIGAMNGIGAPLVVLAVLWGLVVAGFGMTQQRFLIGDLHWIIRVLHLAVGIAALMISARIDDSLRRSPSGRSSRMVEQA